MSGACAIAVVGLKKTFRPPASLRLLLALKLRGAPVVALDGIDLEVRAGEIFGLMGENGAGKSTLLRILAGLLVATDGTVTVAGLDAARGGSALAERVGYLAADERGLTPQLSPREHLAFFGALHGFARRAALARADALLARLGLEAQARRPLGELSTGMRRRTGLARALLGAPSVLLLDEPTRGLDPSAAAGLRALLDEQARAGCAVVAATHDVEEARTLCHRVALVQAGRFAAVDEPARVTARWSRAGA